jgi:trk system potassium uptake protein TrkA
MPIGPGLALGEVRPPEELLGKTLVEANLRKTHNVNVVAVRRNGAEELSWAEPSYILTAEDTLLVAGADEALFTLSGAKPPRKRRSLSDFLHGMVMGAEKRPEKGKEANGKR